MTKSNNQHVVPLGKDWAIKGVGNTRTTKIVSTQKEAIKIAENIARNKHSDTKIHGKDGRIRSGNSYGNDPFPPKDKK